MKGFPLLISNRKIRQKSEGPFNLKVGLFSFQFFKTKSYLLIRASIIFTVQRLYRVKTYWLKPKCANNMRLNISIVIFLFVSSFSFGQETSNGTNKITTAVFEINGMACQEGCADKISSNVMAAEGVSSAIVSYEKKEAIIEFNPNAVSITDLKSIITNTKVKDYIYTIGKTTIEQ